MNDNAELRFTQPLHVLEVLGNAIVGGMEVWVERFVDRLPKDRFRITMVCPFEGPLADRLRSRGLSVHVIPMPDQMLWLSVNQTRLLVNQLGIDILHAHLPNAHLLAGLAGRLCGRPVLTTIHGRELAPLDIEVHHAVSSHLSTVCWHSYSLAASLGLEMHHLSCEPNGVDPEAFQPRCKQGTLHRALHLREDAPLIGFVGRLSPEKGPEVLVQAAQTLHHTHPQAHVVFIGEGPMQSELVQRVAQAGLTDNVHFCGVHADMPQLYNELEVLVSCSFSEALPLAVLEAMASSLPVVATAVGGVPDLVTHGLTGSLVEPGNATGIAGHLAHLLDNPITARAMGQHGRARILACWNLDESVARVAQLLTRLARPRKPAQRGAVEHGSTVGFPKAVEIVTQ